MSGYFLSVNQPEGAVKSQTEQARQAPVRTLDDAEERLRRIVAGARAGARRAGFFAAVYRQLIHRVRQDIAAGRFADAARMEALEVGLANRYLAASDALAGGGAAARCWALAWTADRDDRLVILQNVLLGFAAHVELDLGVAAAEAGAGGAIDALLEDFGRRRQVAVHLLQDVEAAIGRCSPNLPLLAQLAGSAGGILDFGLEAAWLDAWNHALVLAHLPPAAWPAALDSFDQQATYLGRLIADPGGLAGKAVEIVRLT
jgi:hypothetical protein